MSTQAPHPGGYWHLLSKPEPPLPWYAHVLIVCVAYLVRLGLPLDRACQLVQVTRKDALNWAIQCMGGPKRLARTP